MQCAPVAQLDRVPDYGSGGREFESSRARHLLLQMVALILKESSNFVRTGAPFLFRSGALEIILEPYALHLLAKTKTQIFAALPMPYSLAFVERLFVRCPFEFIQPFITAAGVFCPLAMFSAV